MNLLYQKDVNHDYELHVNLPIVPMLKPITNNTAALIVVISCMTQSTENVVKQGEAEKGNYTLEKP